jgi:NADPH:quinone reductase-like Zn-dependent oxidoreductase
MKAMVCERFGGPEVLALRELADPPAPAAGEIQVRIAARGVQYVDVLMLAGKTLAQAGVFRGAYTTAYHALLQRGRLAAGEWVLVHGAAGGIGIAAIQVAKAFGAKVIATAGSEAKRAACLEEGADHAIDYRDGFVDAVKVLTGAGWTSSMTRSVTRWRRNRCAAWPGAGGC